MHHSDQDRAGSDLPDVLFLGPLPPPVGGYTSLFEALLAAWQTRVGATPTVINTSPGRLKNRPGIRSIRDVWRGVKLAALLVVTARNCDAVVFVATPALFQRLLPVARLVRRWFDVAFVVWFSGGVVHEAIEQMPAARRRRVLETLDNLNGVIVETGIALAGMRALGIEHAIAVPNLRVVRWDQLPPPRAVAADGHALKLVFFSRIIPEKGIFVLIDAVRQAIASGTHLTLDVYGPVEPSCAGAFERACRDTEGVQYRGVYTGDAPTLLAGYDAVVLPTWFAREGHPGVLIEAMIAGVPAVSCRHLAIPELITDGENGWLVPPRSVSDLTACLMRLAGNPAERFAMGAAHRKRLRRHDAAHAVDTIANLITRRLPTDPGR